MKVWLCSSGRGSKQGANKETLVAGWVTEGGVRGALDYLLTHPGHGLDGGRPHLHGPRHPPGEGAVHGGRVHLRPPRRALRHDPHRRRRARERAEASVPHSSHCIGGVDCFGVGIVCGGVQPDDVGHAPLEGRVDKPGAAEQLREEDLYVLGEGGKGMHISQRYIVSPPFPEYIITQCPENIITQKSNIF